MQFMVSGLQSCKEVVDYSLFVILLREIINPKKDVSNFFDKDLSVRKLVFLNILREYICRRNLKHLLQVVDYFILWVYNRYHMVLCHRKNVPQTKSTIMSNWSHALLLEAIKRFTENCWRLDLCRKSLNTFDS